MGEGYTFYQGGMVQEMKKGGWIKKAAASIKRRGTAGKCTPITKPGCTGRAKALAKTFKKIARNRKKKEYGGPVQKMQTQGTVGYGLSNSQSPSMDLYSNTPTFPNSAEYNVFNDLYNTANPYQQINLNPNTGVNQSSSVYTTPGSQNNTWLDNLFGKQQSTDSFMGGSGWGYAGSAASMIGNYADFTSGAPADTWVANLASQAGPLGQLIGAGADVIQGIGWGATGGKNQYGEWEDPNMGQWYTAGAQLFDPFTGFEAEWDEGNYADAFGSVLNPIAGIGQALQRDKEEQNKAKKDRERAEFEQNLLARQQSFVPEHTRMPYAPTVGGHSTVASSTMPGPIQIPVKPETGPEMGIKKSVEVMSDYAKKLKKLKAQEGGQIGTETIEVEDGETKLHLNPVTMKYDATVYSGKDHEQGGIVDQANVGDYVLSDKFKQAGKSLGEWGKLVAEAKTDKELNKILEQLNIA